MKKSRACTDHVIEFRNSYLIPQISGEDFDLSGQRSAIDSLYRNHNHQIMGEGNRLAKQTVNVLLTGPRVVCARPVERRVRGWSFCMALDQLLNDLGERVHISNIKKKFALARCFSWHATGAAPTATGAPHCRARQHARRTAARQPALGATG
jgi:hypothetical protein